MQVGMTILSQREGRLSCSCLSGLLIESNDVSARIAETPSDLRRVSADRLNYFSAARGDLVESFLDAVDHYVDEHSYVLGRPPVGSPGSTHLACGIIKCGTAVSPFPDLPAEHGRIESRRRFDIRSRKFYVADFS